MNSTGNIHPLRPLRFLIILCLALASCGHQSPAPETARSASDLSPDRKSLRIPVGPDFLTLTFPSDDIAHVVYAGSPTYAGNQSLAVVPQGASTMQCRRLDSRHLLAFTASLQASIDTDRGSIEFRDAAGHPILVEASRSLSPATVQGQSTLHVQQTWKPIAGEALYGLGENQLGLVNIKGYDLELWQHNGTIAIPFLVSTAGYGILWDNPSYTRFGDLRPFAPIPPNCLMDAAAHPGSLSKSEFEADFTRRLSTTRSSDIAELPAPRPRPATRAPRRRTPETRWQGQIVPPVTGDYQFRAYSDGGINVWIDHQLLMDHWRQDWLPWYDLGRIRLEQGHPVPITVEWTPSAGSQIQLLWKPPIVSSQQSPPTSLWSECGQGINYYFIRAPKIDDAVRAYRTLTGPAPMMPKWAFGLWQSRQRYETARQSLDIIDGFRSRKIPFDNIVQDWMYWPRDAWGSHQFDRARFPDPVGWIKAIHDRHAQVMISVWPKFYVGAANFDAMQSRGFLYQPNLQEHLKDWIGFAYTFYDAFNPAARALFWDQIKTALFDKGIDAWWLDASEPDLLPTPSLPETISHMSPTALGPSSRVLNAYPLMNGQAIYDGQLAAAPNQRVFILTRSGYLGQQRYAEASWSGDTSSTWTALRKQIPAGLSFCVSGVPYWTMDIGGFSVPPRFSRNPTPDALDEWRELNTRWFEFGTFCPLLRVHGEYPYREMWNFGGESSPAYRAQLKFDQLRYRLLPYIYSLAGQVTLDGSTIMRPLVMDFPTDAQARDISDEYMFGPALLVRPVTAYRARSRSVYLPAGATWYDFWTGQQVPGSQTIDAPAPYDAIPLYIRAGSIVPFGPALQYALEKPADPITLYVYTGADGRFTLYEDDGLTNDDSRGQYSTISLDWNDRAQTLTLGARRGSFPKMLKHRRFKIVFVTAQRSAGYLPDRPADRAIDYDGNPVAVSP